VNPNPRGADWGVASRIELGEELLGRQPSPVPVHASPDERRLEAPRREVSRSRLRDRVGVEVRQVDDEVPDPALHGIEPGLVAVLADVVDGDVEGRDLHRREDVVPARLDLAADDASPDVDDPSVEPAPQQVLATALAGGGLAEDAPDPGTLNHVDPSPGRPRPVSVAANAGASSSRHATWTERTPRGRP